MRRAGAILVVLISASVLAPLADARATGDRRLASTGSARAAVTSSSDRVTLRGLGAAHGLGLAMDGVEGQARAGWKYNKILSLFYPGTKIGRADGTIRVGLAEGGVQRFVLPGGGDIMGAGRSQKVSSGEVITIVVRNGRPVVEGVGRPSSGAATKAETAPAAAPNRASLAELGLLIEASDPVPLPPLLSPPPSEPPPKPKPKPTPKPGPGNGAATPPPGAERSPGGPGSLRIVPSGDPGLVQVDSTGHRYRGSIEVRAEGSSLRVINHVGLETYLKGIAEAKGSGWPIEGLKALAVAARTFAANKMSRSSGSYDICPTQNCQVYLGFDGEEAAMRRAVAETAGEIREFAGRPILAMYHANGGGQTESYSKLVGGRSNAHPYLASVRYPHASPKIWQRELTYREIGAAVSALPGPVERLEILERGDSPRVINLRLHTRNGSRDISGTRFAAALDLWSTWFDVVESGHFASASAAQPPPRLVDDALPVSRAAGNRPWWVLIAIAAMAGLAFAGALEATALRFPIFVRIRWRLAWSRSAS